MLKKVKTVSEVKRGPYNQIVVLRRLLRIACRQIQDYSDNEYAINPDTNEDFHIKSILAGLDSTDGDKEGGHE